jgi:hypothetical protein
VYVCPDVDHPHPLSPKPNTHAQGAIRKFPKSTLSQRLPVFLHFRFLSLPLAPLLYSALACGARYGSVRRKDSMSASASLPPAGEEKQEAVPVRRCKGVNDLDKVMLREVRGSSAEVLVCHSHESPGMFRLSRAAPQRYPSATPISHRACSGCQIPAQICGACHGAVRSPTSLLLPAFSLPYVAYVCFKCFRHFICALQLFHLDVAKIDRGMLHMLQVF